MGALTRIQHTDKTLHQASTVSASPHSFSPFLLSPPGTCCTYIPSGQTMSWDFNSVLNQSFEHLFHALSSFTLVFSSCLPDHKLLSLQLILHYMLFLPSLPQPPSLLTLGSELTWTPSAIFSLSLSLPLCLCWSRELRDVPTAHSTHFLSPNMGKRSPARLDC